jgi:DNA (cytosine-5)-methyltransferase 1
MSLGFKQAGFDVAAAIEIGPVHCAVYKFNFPKTAVVPHSVRSVSASQIRDAARIGSNDADRVFGGPPCQGFSMMGQRALDDPRKFVFENVKRFDSWTPAGFSGRVGG